MSQYIEGEYQTVQMGSKEFALLSRAHADLIDREEARRIVRYFAPDLQVRFSGFRGRTPKHRRWISLPTGKFPPRRRAVLEAMQQIGRLRVGIVLHELAHYFGEDLKHDFKFVYRLDRLLYRWYFRVPW